jgi:hypothetical protein
MMKRLALLLLLFLLFLSAQTRDNYRMNPDPPAVIARISFVIPQFVLEFAPVDHFSFSSGLWIRTRFWTEDESGNHEFQPLPSLEPRLRLEPRYYFNLDKRNRKGRRTDYYSGWYVGIPFGLSFPDLKFSLGTTLGFQCTFGKRWYWNAGGGPGFVYEEQGFRMTGAITAGFGVILN